MSTQGGSIRTYVVTGAASGIGAATMRLLREGRQNVIGVDRHSSDIEADLATVNGRVAAARAIVEQSNGVVDALITCAGLRFGGADTISVNVFGSVDLVQLLRDPLLNSKAPRVVMMSSIASVTPSDQDILDACLRGDEPRARSAAQSSEPDETGRSRVYSSSKTAISQWVRRNAANAEWAGSGILINAVGPGLVTTPMTADMRETEESRTRFLTMLPNALQRFAEPEEIAEVITWLASSKNSLLVGQTVFADLGTDVMLRGDTTW